MRYVTIPGSTLYVSQLCLGTANFGERCDEAVSFRRLDEFVDHGGNLLDTAHCYSDWKPGEKHRSEKLIGKWMQTRCNREKIILGTKGGVLFDAEENRHWTDLEPSHLQAEIDDSLKNLQTDYVDIYWLHRDDPARPVAELMEFLHKQVTSGKARYIGCSNWEPERIRETQTYAKTHGLTPFLANELEWSIPRRLAPDRAVDPKLPPMHDQAMTYHKESGLTAFAFTSMASGFYQKLEAAGESGISDGMRNAFLTSETLAGFQRLEKLKAESGLTTAQILMGYIRGQQDFTGIPIAFGRTDSQAAELYDAADSVLDRAQIAYLLNGKY